MTTPTETAPNRYAYWQNAPLSIAGSRVLVATKPGVYAHGTVDPASMMLAEAVASLALANLKDLTPVLVELSKVVCTVVADELDEVPGAQALAGQVVEPDRHAGGGQVGESVHRGLLEVCRAGAGKSQSPDEVAPSEDSDARAAATVRSAVRPNCSNST